MGVKITFPRNRLEGKKLVKQSDLYGCEFES